jgi:predicted membrane protein
VKLDLFTIRTEKENIVIKKQCFDIHFISVLFLLCYCLIKNWFNVISVFFLSLYSTFVYTFCEAEKIAKNEKKSEILLRNQSRQKKQGQLNMIFDFNSLQIVYKTKYSNWILRFDYTINRFTMK